MVEECYHGTGTITTQLPRPVPCLRLGVQLPQSADTKYMKLDQVHLACRTLVMVLVPLALVSLFLSSG